MGTRGERIQGGGSKQEILSHGNSHRESRCRHPISIPSPGKTAVRSGTNASPPFKSRVPNLLLRVAPFLVLATAMLLPAAAFALPDYGFWVTPLECPSSPAHSQTQNAHDSPLPTATPRQTRPKVWGSGAFATAPWKAKTNINSRILLKNNQLEIRADSKTHFELVRVTPDSLQTASNPAPGSPPVVNSALKSHAPKVLGFAHTCASVLLHQGSLCLSKKNLPGRPTLLVAKTVTSSCVFSTAKASIGCDAWGNTRISVYEGEIHVRPVHGKSFLLRTGQTALLENALPPSLGLLSDFPDALEQRRVFDALNRAQPDPSSSLDGQFSPPARTVPTQTPDAVGNGALVPFDLKSRRQSILLQPASPDVNTPEDVSPELPVPR